MVASLNFLQIDTIRAMVSIGPTKHTFVETDAHFPFKRLSNLPKLFIIFIQNFISASTSATAVLK